MTGLELAKGVVMKIACYDENHWKLAPVRPTQVMNDGGAPWAHAKASLNAMCAWNHMLEIAPPPLAGLLDAPLSEKQAAVLDAMQASPDGAAIFVPWDVREVLERLGAIRCVSVVLEAWELTQLGRLLHASLVEDIPRAREEATEDHPF